MSNSELAAPKAHDGDEHALVLNSKLGRELRRYLELGAVQVDAAMKEANQAVDSLSSAVTAVQADARELVAQIWALESGDPERARQALAQLRIWAGRLTERGRTAIRTLQFYDKLVQRLSHVRDGLALPVDWLSKQKQPSDEDYERLLEEVRARYSMAEERALFDFMMCGLSAEQMFKALMGLKGTTAAGELELF
jgi:hypothetical protein